MPRSDNIGRRSGGLGVYAAAPVAIAAGYASPPPADTRRSAQRCAAGSLRRNADHVISITGDIDDETASRAITELMAARARRRNVLLQIDSRGGSPVAALRIRAAIHRARRSGLSIHAVAKGQCASAATVIFAAADFRECAPDMRFVLHRVAVGASIRLTAERLRGLASRNEALDQRIFAAYRPVFRFRADELEKWDAGEDIVIDAFNAAVRGFVHHVTGGAARIAGWLSPAEWQRR